VNVLLPESSIPEFVSELAYFSFQYRIVLQHVIPSIKLIMRQYPPLAGHIPSDFILLS
jgi:hypothetical protein